MFDKQNFDELIVAFIGKVLTGKRLEGKTLRIAPRFSTVKVLCYTVRSYDIPNSFIS